MLMGTKSSSDVHPLIELGDRGTPKTVGACAYRRHYQKLAFHQQRARKEFIEIIGRVAASQPNYDDPLSDSIKLATLLNDSDCAQHLSAMLPDREAAVCNPLSVLKPAQSISTYHVDRHLAPGSEHGNFVLLIIEPITET